MHHGVVHLHAEFVPPPELRQALGGLVRGLEPAVDEPVARRGLLGRRTAAPAAVAGPQLVVEDVERMVLPITDFGYLAARAPTSPRPGCGWAEAQRGATRRTDASGPS